MKTRHFTISIVALALAAPFSQPSFAQGVELEEIVVTARKRSESLLEIPITI